MDPDLSALARCVGDVGLFAEAHWGRTPLLRRAAGPFTDLLDLAAIDELLASTARRPTFRLVKDGQVVPEAVVTTTVRLGGATVTDAADVGQIGDRVAAGATLVLQGLQRTWLPVARFCRSLERATSHAVQANAYLTPPGAAGLGRHDDTHDVLVLQIQGCKAWDVDGLGPLELSEGDVLYLPAGTAHAASAQEEASLHLTIGLLRDTFRSAVARALAELDALDEPLPLGFARAEGRDLLRERLRAVLDVAAEHLEKADVEALAAAEADRSARRRRPLLTDHLTSVLAPVDDGTKLRRRPGLPPSLELREGAVDLHLVDRTLHLPPHALPALEIVVAQDSFTVRDLCGLDEPGRRTLARRLVREGLLVVEP